MGGRRVALRSRAAEGGTRRRNDPSRLGAHAEHATAARGQDLEVELVKADAELAARGPESLFDCLAGELLVGTHISVVSLVDRENAWRVG